MFCPSGVCGFLTFGANVSQDVLMSYPSNDVAVAIARAFIVVCVVTSYPILHFCGRFVVCLSVGSVAASRPPTCACSQGRRRGTVAAFPGRAGGGVRPPRAQAARRADAAVVRDHPPPRPLHPRHRPGDIADRRIGRLLHFCLSG